MLLALLQAALDENNPKTIYAVYLSLRSVVKKTQDTFGSTPEHQRLVTACERLKQ